MNQNPINTFTCSNSNCGKKFEGRQFHCYNYDCCSSQCLQNVISAKREAEALKKSEMESRDNRNGRQDYGGNNCY